MRTEKDNEILNALKNDKGRLLSSRTSVAYLKKHGMYDYLINRYKDNTTDEMAEIIHRLANDIETVPVCPMCGKPITFSMNSRSYSNWCSPKCRNNDPEVKAKNAAGVSKYRLAEYADPVKRAEVTAKKIATLKAHTGEDNNGSPFCCKQHRDKAHQTINERYGVDNVLTLEKNREKMRKSIREKSVKLWADRGYTISYPDDDHVLIHNGCPIHGDVLLTLREFNNRMKPERRALVPFCPKCHPIAIHSGMEIAVKDILSNINPELEYTTNDRTVIKPLELDFVLPEHNTAIEVNGIYYHNEENKPSDYHNNKSNLCESMNLNLIHVWEHDIEQRKPLVADLIRRQLNYPASNRVNFDDTFMSCDRYGVKEFMDRYCMYGYDKRTTIAVRISTKYETLMMMTFGNTTNDGEIDLLGIGMLPEYDVYGFPAIKALLDFAVGVLRVHSDVCYKKINVLLSRDYYKKSWFESMGMAFEGIVDDYTWIDYNGKVLKKCDYPEYYNDDLDENVIEMLHDESYFRCYNSGLMKFSINV